MRLILMAMLVGCAGSTVTEIECEDLDELNRGGSIHVIAPADAGGVFDSVWCGDVPDLGVQCEDVPWWVEDGEVVTACPVVGEDEDRGSLWVRVER